MKIEQISEDRLQLLVSDEELNMIIGSLGESLEALRDEEVSSVIGLDSQSILVTIDRLRRQQNEFDGASGE